MSEFYIEKQGLTAIVKVTHRGYEIVIRNSKNENVRYYAAGNDKLDSFQVVPPFSKFAVPIETLKEYARQTSNEMLDEVLSEQIINKLEEHGIEIRTF